MSNATAPGADGGDPSRSGWAGEFSDDHWMFVRHGRWHIHDSHTGEVLGILPLIKPLNIDYDTGEP